MRIVVQRSKKSHVSVDGKIVGEIQKGMILLVCFEKDDSEEVIEKSSKKISALRIFEDPETGKMNKSLTDIDGEILCVSQFTLSWDGKKGNRPGFDNSMQPDKANQYFERFCQCLREQFKVETGVFGANMQVAIENDGPVTFFLEF